MKSALVCVLFIATLYPAVNAQTLNVIGSLAFTPEFAAFYNLSAPIRNVLNSTGPITVFAPTNQAVQQFLRSLPPGFNNPELTRRILLYHVAPGYILLQNITQASPILSLNGGFLNTTMIGTSIGVDNFALILSQFPQVNGNIFTINRVLMPLGVSLVPPTPIATSAAPVPTSAAPVPTSAAPVPTSAAPVPTSVAPIPTSAAPVPTSAAPVPTSEAPTPAPPQFVGLCTDQACCTARAFPNLVTGDGFLEFNPICNDGGLHCDDNTGCLICHDPAVMLNIFNRPLCNVSTVEPYAPCGDQACCTARMTPNTNTGYGYLEFISSCDQGGTNCFDETGCIDCFNPLPGTVNILNRPVCSAEAIRSFGFVPQATQTQATVATAEETITQEVVITAATTVAAKRSLLEVKASTATLALPAVGVLLAMAAVVR